MTLNDVRLDLIKRGFMVQEHNQATPQGICVFIYIGKRDVDQAVAYANINLGYRDYEVEDNVKNVLIEASNHIDKNFLSRREKDTDFCNHEPIMTEAYTKVCRKCMYRYPDPIFKVGEIIGNANLISAN